MNILTTYLTASCLFTFVRQGTMYTEFNSITFVLYTQFQNCAKDVSMVTAQHIILGYIVIFQETTAISCESHHGIWKTNIFPNLLTFYF